MSWNPAALAKHRPVAARDTDLADFLQHVAGYKETFKEIFV